MFLQSRAKKVKSCGREKASINLSIKHNHIGLCTDERLVISGCKIFLYFIIYSISMSQKYGGTQQVWKAFRGDY